MRTKQKFARGLEATLSSYNECHLLCVCVPLSYHLPFEAALFVLSEKYSLLCSSACWERYMVGCGFCSSWAASAEQHLQEPLRHSHVPFPSRRGGGFYPYFLLPMKFCVKGTYLYFFYPSVCVSCLWSSFHLYFRCLQWSEVPFKNWL